jgi:hypothetical protein
MTPTTLTPAELAVYTAAFGAAFALEYRRARDSDDFYRSHMSGAECVASASAAAKDQAAQQAKQAVLAFREVHPEDKP